MSVGTKTAEESPKYRSPEEIFVDKEAVGKKSLANILKNHKQWLKTNGRSGERAVLDDADLSRADLSAANLQEARLNATKLSGANLSCKANLREAKLEGADLSGANLQDANLEKALLWGADLPGAQLQEANLLKARLYGANLEGADLTDAKGLLSGQLAGTVLAGAKLAQSLTKFEPLGIVEEVSKNARKVFVAILLGCLYCLLSITLATDADLLINGSSGF